jgi:hypothetical protein
MIDMRSVLRPILWSVLLVSPLLANAKFNGRWDLTVVGEPRGRAWWLEIEGAGTAAPKGKFVSAYAGDMNVIDEISIQGNDLTFGFAPKGPRGHIVFKAKLNGDRIEGTRFDSGKQGLSFRGVRAPEIRETDDGSWKKGKPVDLFNGKDMTGWKPLIPNRPLGWVIKDGVLVNEPKANNLISEQKFWNYELHVEFRVGEHSNSGVGLRGRYEIQILEDYGKPPDTHSNAALYSRVAPAVNPSKPAGEWQTFDIRLVGRTVSVVANGKKVLDKVTIEGLTAVAVDPHEGQPGPLILQGDHGSVEFRKIVLTPLTR